MTPPPPAPRVPGFSENYLTAGEVASILRVSKMSVYRMANTGEIDAIRVGRSIRIPESAVRAYTGPEPPPDGNGLTTETGGLPMTGADARPEQTAPGPCDSFNPRETGSLVCKNCGYLRGSHR